MLTQLKNFGLNEKEAKVYLAALELGSDTVINISKKAGVNRSTAYVEIEALMQMGLMSSFEKGKKRYFTAESPEGLKNVLTAEEEEIRLRKQQLEKFLPELQAIQNKQGNKPSVRFFEGGEALKAMESEVLALPAGTELVSIYSVDEAHEAYSSTRVEKFLKNRIKKGIKYRGLYKRKEGPFKDNPPKLTEDRYISSDFPVKGDITVYGNKVFMQTLTGTYFGVIIESESFATTLRTLFELAWKKCE